MKNFIQRGDILDFVAPSGGVVGGLTYKKGVFVHVAASTAAEGVTYAGDVTGVFELAAATSQAWTQGDLLYWDDTAKVFTKTAGSNAKAGAAAADKLAASATGSVKLITQI